MGDKSAAVAACLFVIASLRSKRGNLQLDKLRRCHYLGLRHRALGKVLVSRKQNIHPRIDCCSQNCIVVSPFGRVCPTS
jgi:hypothetical protein